MAMPAICVLAMVPISLVWSSSPAALWAGVQHQMFAPALWLSLWTSTLTTLLALVFGCPLAWWLARRAGPTTRHVVRVLVDLPILLPPSVVGLALLLAYGRLGLLGSILERVGVHFAFASSAVVMAQFVVAAPLLIQSATAAFSRIDPDALLVARSLGCTRLQAWRQVALPMALPGVLTGSLLCWARAMGEFGATLLFAGNLQGTTQTMPLAIYTAMNTDVRLAVALAIVLGVMALFAMTVLRLFVMRWGYHAQS